MSQATVAALFERHHVRVFRFLVRLLGDRALAEDVLQDVFVRVVRGIGDYREREREVAWLFRIAVNLVRDEARRRARRPQLVATEAVDESASVVPIGLGLELDQALARLAEAERTAFLLRELGGLSYDEIARVERTTVPGVRSRIFRARRALQATLGPERGACGEVKP